MFIIESLEMQNRFQIHHHLIFTLTDMSKNIRESCLRGSKFEAQTCSSDCFDRMRPFESKYLTIYSGTFWLLISLGISWHIPEKMVQNFRPGT